MRPAAGDALESRISVAAEPPPEPRVALVPPGVRAPWLKLPNWLGDVVLAGPAVAAIARALPGARITVEAPAPFVPLARMLPGVHEALPAPRAGGIGALRRAARVMRERGHDAAVLFPRSARAALVPWWARVPVRVGLASDARGRLLTHAVESWRPWRRAHRTAYFGLLARAFGAALPEDWRLVAPSEALGGAERLLARLGHRRGAALVVLEPGASYGPAKCWPPERYGALAARLLARGIDVLTIGTPAAADVERRIARAAGGRLLRGVGQTGDLGLLCGVLARARCVVTNDTGPMHVAAALGVPVVALFGASDPVVSGPRGPGPRTVIFDPEPCSPCFLRRCAVPGHPCLTKIGVDRVERAVEPFVAD